MARSAPTPELLAQVDALGPATADPNIDVEAESRESPDFRFLRFLRRYRNWLLVGLVLVALDAACTLAGPILVRYGIDNGVAATPQNADAIWAAAGVFLVIVLIDWYLMWAEARVMGRASERMLHALRVKVFAHLQRLGVDYYEHEMAGRIMTRMTTDIDALSQLLQNGLVNALVNLVTFVGVGVALVFMDPTLALITAAILPPLVIATLWFRSASTRAYGIARDRIAAVNANLQEGLSGVRVSQAFVREDKNQEVFSGIASDYRDARVHAQRLVAIYFPFVDFLSDIATRHRARRGQRLRRQRIAVGRITGRVPAVSRPLLRADPAALAGVRLVPAGAGRDRAHHRAARHADDRSARRRAGRSRPVGGRRRRSTTFVSATRVRSTTRSGVSTCASSPVRPSRWSARPARARAR